MDIGGAFSSPTRDSRWKGKVALGVLISWVPLVSLALSGWGISYVREVYEGRDTQLPEWSDFGRHWTHGLVFGLASLIYYTPVLAILFAFMIPAGVIGSVENMDLAGAYAALGSVATGLLVSVLFALVVSVLTQAARVHYAIHGTFAAAFDAKGILAAVKRNPGAYFTAWFMGVIAVYGVALLGGLLGGAVSAIPCFGTVASILIIPALAALGVLVGQGANALWGQYARIAYGSPLPAHAAAVFAPGMTAPMPQAPGGGASAQFSPPGLPRTDGTLPGSSGLSGQAAVAAALASLGESPGVATGDVAAPPPAPPIAPTLFAQAAPAAEADAVVDVLTVDTPVQEPSPDPIGRASNETVDLVTPASESLEEVAPLEVQHATEPATEPEPSATAAVESEPVLAIEPDTSIVQPTVEIAAETPEELQASDDSAVPEGPAETDEFVPAATELPDLTPIAPLAEDVQPESIGDGLGTPGEESVSVAAASVMFALSRSSGPGRAGERWVLPRSEIRIGRDEHCFIVLPDPKMSRVHAIVRSDAISLSIADAGSSNGTLVNAVAIGREPVRLGAGDTIQLGDTVLAVSTVE